MPGHPQALTAAKAAECADQQGRFAEMRKVLFARQSEMGKEKWPSFAADAGVPQLADFSDCLQSQLMARIDAGLSLSQSLSFRGTPTVVINGWRFEGAPPDTVLAQTIDDLLAGKTPRVAR